MIHLTDRAENCSSTGKQIPGEVGLKLASLPRNHVLKEVDVFQENGLQLNTWSSTGNGH